MKNLSLLLFFLPLACLAQTKNNEGVFSVRKDKMHLANEMYFFFDDDVRYGVEMKKPAIDSSFFFTKHGSCVNCEELFPVKLQYEAIEVGYRLILLAAFEKNQGAAIWLARAKDWDGSFLRFIDL